jgi:hypothetical protein
LPCNTEKTHKEKKEMTQKKIKKLIHYDPVSGFVMAKVNFGTRTKVGDIIKSKKNKYLRLQINNRRYVLHRLIWLYMTGSFPEKYIDHINHDKTDNRWENLREVSHRDNCRNFPMLSTNTSGQVGVSWNKEKNMWRARINIDDKEIFLGYFVEFHKAVDARKNAEVLYGFHENHGLPLPGPRKKPKSCKK